MIDPLLCAGVAEIAVAGVALVALLRFNLTSQRSFQLIALIQFLLTLLFVVNADREGHADGILYLYLAVLGLLFAIGTGIAVVAKGREKSGTGRIMPALNRKP